MSDKETLRNLIAGYFDDRCPRCHGTKWVIESGLARRCDCFVRELLQFRLASANIPDSYAQCSFANFFPQRKFPGQYKALESARSYVQHFETDFLGKGLIFRGAVGTGKTHLAAAVLKGLIEKGFSGVFVNFVHLLERITNSYDNRQERFHHDIIMDFSRCHAVVLDELGAAKPSEYVFHKLYDLVNYCFDKRIAVIFTTNYTDALPSSRKLPPPSDFGKAEEVARPPAALTYSAYTLAERISERLYSRIMHHCKEIVLDGEDYRLKNRS